jgi:hypothetical protein
MKMELKTYCEYSGTNGGNNKTFRGSKFKLPWPPRRLPFYCFDVIHHLSSTSKKTITRRIKSSFSDSGRNRDIISGTICAGPCDTLAMKIIHGTVDYLSTFGGFRVH